MGRLIDADKAISDYAHYGISHPYDAYDLEDILTECPTIEAIPKDEYENRLKADMVAILEDLDLLIDEFDPGCGWDGYIKKIDVQELIQQKINALGGNDNEHS